jgi:hypothetical protein
MTRASAPDPVLFREGALAFQASEKDSQHKRAFSLGKSANEQISK